MKEAESIENRLKWNISDKIKGLKHSVEYLERNLYEMIDRRELIRKSDVKKILDAFFKDIDVIEFKNMDKIIDRTQLYKKLGLE